jgi:hypothetical protein
VASSAVQAISIAASARGKDLWNAVIDEALRLPWADPTPAPRAR